MTRLILPGTPRLILTADSVEAAFEGLRCVFARREVEAIPIDEARRPKSAKEWAELEERAP
jgi:hypothetical protein